MTHWSGGGEKGIWMILRAWNEYRLHSKTAHTSGVRELYLVNSRVMALQSKARVIKIHSFLRLELLGSFAWTEVVSVDEA
jgi:hypothetical protein